MKVYVVTQGEYSDYHIEQIFTDRDKAELFCTTLNVDYYAPPEIEEYETDEVKIEGEFYRYVVGYGTKEIKYDGTWKYRLYNYEIVRYKNPIKEEFEETLIDGRYRYKFTVAVNKYITLNQAKKIAEDRWNKFGATETLANGGEIDD